MSQRQNDRVGSAGLEELEQRRLFSGVEVTELGTMVITGTPGPDVIHVTRYGTDLATQINGSLYFTPAASVRRFIRLEALDGADRADISASITLPADLYGGPGNDTLTGGGGTDN